VAPVWVMGLEDTLFFWPGGNDHCYEKCVNIAPLSENMRKSPINGGLNGKINCRCWIFHIKLLNYQRKPWVPGETAWVLLKIIYMYIVIVKTCLDYELILAAIGWVGEVHQSFGTPTLPSMRFHGSTLSEQC
jgi:hypothetical protein